MDKSWKTLEEYARKSLESVEEQKNRLGMNQHFSEFGEGTYDQNAYKNIDTGDQQLA